MRGRRCRRSGTRSAPHWTQQPSVIADVLYSNYGIATRPGAHCAPRLHEALGTVRQGAVRFSFSVFNSEDEADTAIQAVKELAQSK